MSDTPENQDVDLTDLVPVDMPDEEEYFPIEVDHIMSMLCHVAPNNLVQCLVEVDGKKVVGQITEVMILEDQTPLIRVSVPTTGSAVH